MKNLLTSVRIFIVLTIITGIFYPIGMTLLSTTIFPRQANGSLIVENGRIIGSELLAQKTTDSKYFWPRPSAGDYGTIPSGASNQGILSKSLAQEVETRRKTLETPSARSVPADLLYASGSGLDPHISPEAARYQIDRVATERNFSAAQKITLTTLVETQIEPPQFGIFGEARVNVLLLNLALDRM